MLATAGLCSTAVRPFPSPSRGHAWLLATMLGFLVGCGQSAYEAKLKQTVDAAGAIKFPDAKQPAADGKPAAQPAAQPNTAQNANQGSGLTPAGQAILAPLDP